MDGFLEIGDLRRSRLRSGAMVAVAALGLFALQATPAQAVSVLQTFSGVYDSATGSAYRVQGVSPASSPSRTRRRQS